MKPEELNEWLAINVMEWILEPETSIFKEHAQEYLHEFVRGASS